MSASKKKLQRKTLLYLWSEGVHNARELHACTNIPLSTVYDNMKKLKKLEPPSMLVVMISTVVLLKPFLMRMLQ
jgi:hypothetical protein